MVVLYVCPFYWTYSDPPDPIDFFTFLTYNDLKICGGDFVATDHVTVGASMSPAALAELDYLCDAYAMSRSGLIGSLVHAEYDRLHGSPQMREALASLQSIQGQLQRMQEALAQESALASVPHSDVQKPNDDPGFLLV